MITSRDMKPDHTPKTRKELVTYLWNKGRTDCNLVKEGPFYAAIVGRQIRATHERALDRLTFEEWEREHFQVEPKAHLMQ